MKVQLTGTRFLAGLTVLLCSAVVLPQETPKRLEAAAKFDEYGSIRGCDHSARLDNFAINLLNDSNLEGYLVYYGPESASEQTLALIQDYLVNSRGISEERWKKIYAGPNSDPSEPRIQLWLSPQGAPQPEVERYESKVETFIGLFAEQPRWDGIYLGDGGTGPPVPDVTFPRFVEMLKNRKDTVAYIVALNGSESVPGSWRRVAQGDSERLQSAGVPSDRVRIKYGGNSIDHESARVQLWILPKDAPAPVEDAGPERLPDKIIQAGSFDDHELGFEENERWAFNVLLDGLKTNKELRACIIVRLERSAESDEAEQSEDSEAEQTVEIPETVADEIPTTQPADLLKLVEKWKAELTDKHKIGHERVVVLFAMAREYEGPALETWIVPAGASLPDPYAEPIEESTNDTESGKMKKDEGMDPDSVNAKPIEQKTSGASPERNSPPQSVVANTHVIKQVYFVAPVLFNLHKQLQMHAMAQ